MGRPSNRIASPASPYKLALLAIAWICWAVTNGGADLAAQQSIITSEVSCPNCRLSLARVAELGNDDESLINAISTVCRLPDGRFVVAGLSIPYRLVEYDASGSRLRTFGTAGSGPGEFRSIRAATCGEDERVRIFDTGNGRVTVLNEEGTPVASHRLQVGYLEGAYALAGGFSAVNAIIPAAEATGQSVHIIAPDGALVGSFGRIAGGAYRRDAVGDRRIVARARNGDLWVAPMNRYRIESWGMNGVLRQTIERAAAWFEPYTSIPDGEPFTARPRPRIFSLFEDTEGNLWISSLVPSRDWKAVPPERLNLTMAGPTVAMLEPQWDSIIEVIDVRRGRLRYAARLSGLAFQFIGDGLAYRPRERPDGVHYLEVVRMRLMQP